MKSNAFFAILLALTILAWKSIAGDGSAPRSAVTLGQEAPPFKTTTIDGKTVSFPEDYKGKIVLLDFWATWCGPCRKELPNVTSTYNQYHSKGFEILSVSLDKAQQGPALLQFFKSNNMTWPQIYDGHGVKGSVPTRYGIHAIPCPILVDGDTGKIIALDRSALGLKLVKNLESALAAKARK